MRRPAGGRDPTRGIKNSNDRVDNDLDRLEHLNQVIEAGKRTFGRDFLARLNPALGPERALRSIDTVVVRPSEDLGMLAAAFVRSAKFMRRTADPVARLFSRLAAGEAVHDADLLSHLLFDGAFAMDLLALGRADARRQESKIRALLGR